MAASNYMTEADTESIWDTALNTDRFGKIGVRIAEFINFKINRDATSQVTSTAVTPLLEEFSEEVLVDVIAAAKINKTVQPYDFIQANISSYLIKHYYVWEETFDEIREVLSKQYHLAMTDDLELPSSSEGLIKRTTS